MHYACTWMLLFCTESGILYYTLILIATAVKMYIQKVLLKAVLTFYTSDSLSVPENTVLLCMHLATRVPATH